MATLRAPLVFVILALAGCDKLSEAIQNKVQQEVEERVNQAAGELPGGGQAGLTDDERLVEKLNLYVECTNRSTERIYDSWKRYVEYVDEKVGTPRSKSNKPFLYKIDTEIEPCKKAVDEGPGLQPPLPEIEKAMADYYTAAAEFAAHTKTLDAYYEGEDFKDDNWAKGKEVAPKFLAAYTAFDKASGELSRLVDVKKDEADAKMLVLIESREGKKIHWHSENVIIAAKGFVRCVTAENVKAETCETQYKALDEAQGGFRSYYDANKAEADKVFWMSSFESSISNYWNESKKFMRALRDGKVTADDYNTVTRNFNDLINAANNLRFDFP